MVAPWTIYQNSGALRVNLDFARANLMAHVEGPAIARSWLAARRDPFGDDGYETRDLPEGGFCAWSVGPRDPDDVRSPSAEPPVMTHAGPDPAFVWYWRHHR